MMGEAAVAVDLLTPGVRAKDKLIDAERKVLASVAYNAVAEYLRLFPRCRNKGRSWIAMPSGERDAREWDFQCIYCRKSLNTLPMGRGSYTQRFVDTLNAHSELCGAMFLAGMTAARHPTKRHTRMAGDDPKSR
jgi:hypothetical protein